MRPIRGALTHQTRRSMSVSACPIVLCPSSLAPAAVVGLSGQPAPSTRPVHLIPLCSTLPRRCSSRHSALTYDLFSCASLRPLHLALSSSGVPHDLHTRSHKLAALNES
ncbi:hypothetical protein E2C01_005633 [Portunus trituberculatus]|uniref:Uncharacterized protein n=1 Tax=Portunus trituberculatus TaxID=210409 RepID=A0A5B7CSW7_PORTR|nr:hypothetical protein [Portunus trituberculatus]